MAKQHLSAVSRCWKQPGRACPEPAEGNCRVRHYQVPGTTEATMARAMSYHVHELADPLRLHNADEHAASRVNKVTN